MDLQAREAGRCEACFAGRSMHDRGPGYGSNCKLVGDAALRLRTYAGPNFEIAA
ncbi:MAG TPA: hypothetical protein VIN58_11060 [Roseateles sp.]